MPPSPWPAPRWFNVNPSGVVAAMGGSPPTRSCSGVVSGGSPRETGDARTWQKPRMPCCNSRSGANPRPRTARRFIKAIRRKCGPTAASPAAFSRGSRANRRGDSLNCWVCIKRLWTATKNSCTTVVREENRRWWTDFLGWRQRWTAAAFAASFRFTARRPRGGSRTIGRGCSRNWLDGCLAHQRKDGFCFATTSTPVRVSLKPIWRPCSPTQFTRACAAGGSGELSGTPADANAGGGARQGGPGSASSRAWRARRRFDRPGILREGQAFFILMEAAAREDGPLNLQSVAPAPRTAPAPWRFLAAF